MLAEVVCKNCGWQATTESMVVCGRCGVAKLAVLKKEGVVPYAPPVHWNGSRQRNDRHWYRPAKSEW